MRIRPLRYVSSALVYFLLAALVVPIATVIYGALRTLFPAEAANRWFFTVVLGFVSTIIGCFLVFWGLVGSMLALGVMRRRPGTWTRAELPNAVPSPESFKQLLSIDVRWLSYCKMVRDNAKKKRLRNYVEYNEAFQEACAGIENVAEGKDNDQE